MGLGKTYQTIAWLSINPHLRPAVVICQATLKWNWKEELWRHARLRARVLEGTMPTLVHNHRDIFIINYDILAKWAKALKGLTPKVVVIDEVQKIKNRRAVRTKACQSLAKIADHVIGLSGTPILNRPIEFFPILNMIDRARFPSFWNYAFQYCDPKRGFRGRGWDFRGSSNLEELHRTVSPLMLRRKKAEVLTQLPPKIRTVIPLRLSNRAEYRRAELDFIDWLRSKKGEEAAERAKKAQALVQLGSLKELAAEGKLSSIISWVADFLEDTNRKLVLFTEHLAITTQLASAFPMAVTVDGSVAPKDRLAAVKAFQERPERRVFIGNIQAAGTGLTLTAADAVAFVELPWTPAEVDQAEDRILRIGQTSDRVEAFYFIALGSIEEDHLELLDKKRQVVSQILDGTAANVDDATIQKTLLARLLKKGSS
jgi:SWI/SNF-related matrix-associated actin-dependent regulator 1 of chromatin subfamily A